MTNEQKEKIALFRYSVIAPLVTNPGSYSSNQEFFDEQAKKEWVFIDGNTTKFSSSTIERWYYKYKKNGFDSLYAQNRIDRGKPRKVGVDVIELIKQTVENYPRMNAKGIYKNLIKSNEINANDVSYSTINRIYTKIKNTIPENTKQMLRYECKYANDVWCADSSFGLYLYKNKQKIKLVIIAFIDDASRVITSCKIYESDNINNLLLTYKDGIERFGLPKLMNVDNGSNYRSSGYALVNAKLGTGIHYDPVHSPTSKSKIERFFRTLKDQWMASINFHDFKSIEEFQKSLDMYINQYNNTIHSSLNGLSPMQRYINDTKFIRRLDSDKIEDSFLLEISRKATFDSLIVINDTYYQLPPKFSNKKVTVLYSIDLSKVYINDEGNRIEVLKLDKVANSTIKRSYRFTGGND